MRRLSHHPVRFNHHASLAVLVITLVMPCVLAPSVLADSHNPDEAARALAEIRSKHRSHASLRIDATLTIGMKQDGMEANGDPVSATFRTRADGHGRMTLPDFDIFIEPRRTRMTGRANDAAYLERTHRDAPYWTLFMLFGSAERLPFPHVALLWGSDDVDDLCMELYADTPDLVPHSVDPAGEEAPDHSKLTLSSEHAHMEIIFDPTTGFIESIEHRITGGRLVQPGVVRTHRYAFTYTPQPEPFADAELSLDMEGRQRVDHIRALMPGGGDGGGGGGGAQPAGALRVGSAAPEFELAVLDGEAVNLADLRGRVVVLDFWATWCGPCLPVMRTLHELHTWAQEEDIDLVILPINTAEITNPAEDSPEERTRAARAFLERHGFTLPVPMDYDNRVSFAYRVTHLPTTIVIRPDGVIHEMHVGGGAGYADRMKRNIRDAASHTE